MALRVERAETAPSGRARCLFFREQRLCGRCHGTGRLPALLTRGSQADAENQLRGLPPAEVIHQAIWLTPELSVRIGLESGPVVVEATGEVFGDAPNVAARVQAAAEPGSVLVTMNVQRQVAGLFVVEERGRSERRLFRADPPRLSRDIMMRAVAYRLREIAHGGASKVTRRQTGGTIAPPPGPKEGVRTQADSSAKLVLRDKTVLTVGPSSFVKLDRFVYAGEGLSGANAVNVLKGALVFATGNALR